MSIQNASGFESTESPAKQTEFSHYVIVDVTPTVCNVANLEHGEEEAKRHTYSVFHTDGLTERCTCPAHQYQPGKCKHRKAVEDAKDNVEETECRISGPHIGYDCYGQRDHCYYSCENCGAEATDKRAFGGFLGECCQ